jgi:hypothetical protein
METTQALVISLLGSIDRQERVRLELAKTNLS